MPEIFSFPFDPKQKNLRKKFLSKAFTWSEVGSGIEPLCTVLQTVA